ncbi:MAG: hypothetical protein JO085_09240 [Acidimicrobiia bacterium]|nr:hypothetical protein [Acidimicrobiia bacterium]
MKPTRVYLEEGQTWTFACAVDWPGWVRRGKGADAALEALQAYAGRYAEAAGGRFEPGPFEIVGRLTGDASTDFGIPRQVGDWDYEPLPLKEASRLTEILGKCWAVFDRVVADAPSELRKGPRGGGRDRDPIVRHVRDAERGYAPKLGARIPKDTGWADARRILLEALRDPPADAKWPPRYMIRRLAWHVLDHAWEVQDRS